MEEVRKVDEIFAALGVGVGDELIVGEQETEDVRVDDYDAFRVGAVADHIGVQAVDEFFLAKRQACVNCALEDECEIL